MVLIDEQDAASMSGPRDMKEPGDVDWCWQTISALQSMWKSLDLDYERYQRVWNEAEEYRIWEKIPPAKPYGSKEAFLRALEVGDEEAAKVRVSAVAVKARPLRDKPGQPIKGAKKYGGPHNNHDSKYLAARIARDRPDIWERMKAGEFASVAAAAREAGIPIKDRSRVDLSDPLRVAAAIKSHFTPKQVEQIITALRTV